MDYDTIGSDDLLGRLTGRGKGYYYKGMRNVRIFCTCIYILYIIYIYVVKPLCITYTVIFAGTFL